MIPKARKVRKHDLGLVSVPCTADEFGRYDAPVVSTAHREFRDAAPYSKARLVVDTRNMLPKRGNTPTLVRA